MKKIVTIIAALFCMILASCKSDDFELYFESYRDYAIQYLYSHKNEKETVVYLKLPDSTATWKFYPWYSYITDRNTGDTLARLKYGESWVVKSFTSKTFQTGSFWSKVAKDTECSHNKETDEYWVYLCFEPLPDSIDIVNFEFSKYKIQNVYFFPEKEDYKEKQEDFLYYYDKLCGDFKYEKDLLGLGNDFIEENNIRYSNNLHLFEYEDGISYVIDARCWDKGKNSGEIEIFKVNDFSIKCIPMDSKTVTYKHYVQIINKTDTLKYFSETNRNIWAITANKDSKAKIYLNGKFFSDFNVEHKDLIPKSNYNLIMPHNDIFSTTHLTIYEREIDSKLVEEIYELYKKYQGLTKE